MQLSYVGLGVADVPAWLSFATDVLGLTAEREADEARLRVDGKAWRIAVRPSPANDLVYAGIEVDGDRALIEARQRLEGGGVECLSLSVDELASRQVRSGFWFRDPDGLRLEVVHGLADAGTPFRSDIGAGFVTDDEGLGHIVLAVSDLDRAVAFYERVGFAISDFITAPVGPEMVLRIAFLHCNARHHSLALAPLPGGKRLNHLMLEMTGLDDVLRAHRRSVDRGFVTGGLGRHTNDRMLSFYATTPAGFDVECGFGGCKIEGKPEVREYDAISFWGHERS
ncbi:VOC family protein [Rhizorhabdus wittichii]|uniref:VOC family protein n=1 Tax=Rhizorhabdus wittichii TaxID=160791 RepID=UPI001D00DEFA|nr:VOC family protein [Rhizorhabdus wittichii]